MDSQSHTVLLLTLLAEERDRRCEIQTQLAREIARRQQVEEKLADHQTGPSPIVFTSSVATTKRKKTLKKPDKELSTPANTVVGGVQDPVHLPSSDPAATWTHSDNFYDQHCDNQLHYNTLYTKDQLDNLFASKDTHSGLEKLK